MKKQIHTKKAITLFATSALFCSGCLFTQDPSGDGDGTSPHDMGTLPTQDMPADQNEPVDMVDTPDTDVPPEDLGMPDLSPDDLGTDITTDMPEGTMCGTQVCGENEWCDEEDETNITCRQCPTEDPDGACESPAEDNLFLCGERPWFESMFSQCGFTQTTCECPTIDGRISTCNEDTSQCESSCITNALITNHCAANNYIQAMCELGFDTHICSSSTTSERTVKLSTGIPETGVKHVSIGTNIALATTDSALKIYQKNDLGQWTPFTKLNMILSTKFGGTSDYSVKPLAAISANDTIALYVVHNSADTTKPHQVVIIGPNSQGAPTVINTIPKDDEILSLDINETHIGVLTAQSVNIYLRGSTNTRPITCDASSEALNALDTARYLQLVQTKSASDTSSMGAAFIASSVTESRILLCDQSKITRISSTANLLNTSIPLQASQNRLYAASLEAKIINEYVLETDTVTPTFRNAGHEFSSFDVSFNNKTTHMLTSDISNKSVKLQEFILNTTGGNDLTETTTYKTTNAIDEFGSSVALPKSYSTGDVIIIGQHGTTTTTQNVHFATSPK